MNDALKARVERIEYDARVLETAARMLRRYSTPKVAWEMAGDHAADSKERDFWLAVMRRIQREAAA